MHDDDIPLTDQSIRRLLADEAPQWAGLPIRRLVSSGTDNALYRLGDSFLLRLPRREAACKTIAKELDWLAHFADLPLAVPKLLFRGRADLGFQFHFGILEWMEGEIASPENIADPAAAALSLAHFLRALHAKNVEGAPLAGDHNNRRGVALAALSPVTLPAIESLADEIDVRAAGALWQSACAAAFQGPAVWLHGDLKADNLIAQDGQLTGVIDWGLSAVGDPAADYAVAWTWIDPAARDLFRGACGISDEDWLRASGWALYGAVVALSYYRGGRNEALCRQSRLTLSRLGLQ